MLHLFIWNVSYNANKGLSLRLQHASCNLQRKVNRDHTLSVDAF